MKGQLLTPIIFLLVTAALPAALALYVHRRRSGQGAIVLVLLLLAMAEWSLAYALELAVADPVAKVFWSRVKLAGPWHYRRSGWP